MYVAFGAIQIAATMFYIYSNAVVVTYDTVNAVYLKSRYRTDDYVTVLFGTLWNLYGDEWDGWAILVYLEQLFIGNKRLAAYANIMMAAAMTLHPITFPMSMYFWAQIPFNVVLDFAIYPFFPQFDTPQIPW